MCQIVVNNSNRNRFFELERRVVPGTTFAAKRGAWLVDKNKTKQAPKQRSRLSPVSHKSQFTNWPVLTLLPALSAVPPPNWHFFTGTPNRRCFALTDILSSGNDQKETPLGFNCLKIYRRVEASPPGRQTWMVSRGIYHSLRLRGEQRNLDQFCAHSRSKHRIQTDRQRWWSAFGLVKRKINQSKVASSKGFSFSCELPAPPPPSTEQYLVLLLFSTSYSTH